MRQMFYLLEDLLGRGLLVVVGGWKVYLMVVVGLF